MATPKDNHLHLPYIFIVVLLFFFLWPIYTSEVLCHRLSFVRTNTNCITFSSAFSQRIHTLTRRNQMRKNVFETDRKAHCNGTRYRCELVINLYPYSLFCSVSTDPKLCFKECLSQSFFSHQVKGKQMKIESDFCFRSGEECYFQAKSLSLIVVKCLFQF